MPTIDKQISELDEATEITTSDLFVCQQNNQAKKCTGQTLISELADALDGHGGISSVALYSTEGRSKTYKITYADNSGSYFTVQDGEQGYPGTQTYVYIRYSADYPVTTILTTPNKFIGICVGTVSSAPANASDYTWYEWKGAQGDQGVSITGIAYQGTSNLQNTYRITFSNNNYYDLVVTNGSSIQNIAKTGTNGLLKDVYTVTLTNGNTSTFEVTNAKSITSVSRYSGTGLAGSTDVYHINYNDGTFDSFNVVNGLNGEGSVTSVSEIVADANGDVPLVRIESGAPTASSAGYVKQLWFDSTNNAMYVCTVASGNTYTWQSASVSITVDSQMSSSSTNPVQNKVIYTALSGKVDTTRTINGNALSSNITLGAADVGAVPTTRTINGNALSSDVNTRVMFSNTSVATSSFVSDSTYSGYSYKAVITLSGVAASMFPEVVFSPSDAESGNFAPVATAGSGSVTIYAKSVPSAAITIPSIVCFA